MQMSTKSKLESNVNSLVNHLIRWSKDHQASLSDSILGLGEGTLPKKTASSLRAIVCAYSTEVVLVASKLLSEVEEDFGPIPDVLLSAIAVRTKRGYALNAVYVEGIL